IFRGALLRLEIWKPARHGAGSEISAVGEGTLRKSGYAHGKTPGGPENEEKARKEHRQARPRRPLLDDATNKVGDHHADQNKNDVIDEQPHGDASTSAGPFKVPPSYRASSRQDGQAIKVL